MDDEVLLQYLYSRPKFDRAKVDAAWEDYQLLKRRGDKVTFADVIGRKKILSKEEAQKVIAEEQKALKGGTTIKDEDSASRRERNRVAKDAAAASKAAAGKPAKAAAKPSQTMAETVKEAKKTAREAAKLVLVLAVGFTLAIWLAGRVRAPDAKPVDSSSDVLPDEESLDGLIERLRAIAEEGDYERALRMIDNAVLGGSRHREGLLAQKARIQKDSETQKAAKAAMAAALDLVKQGKKAEAAAMLDKFLADHKGDGSKGVRDVAAARGGQGAFGDLIAGDETKKDPTGSGGRDDLTVTGGQPGKGGKRTVGGKRDDSATFVNSGGGDRPGRGPDLDPNITVIDAGGGKRTGRRKISEDASEGRLEVHLGQDDDEKEDGKEPEDPADEKIEPIALVVPKEIEDSRKKAFDTRRARQETDLGKAERYLQAARARRDRAIEDEAKRALAASKAKPLSVELPGPILLRGAIVDRYDRTGFHLKADDGEAGFTWDTSRQELAIRIRALAVRADAAEDHLRFGRWLAARRRTAEARDAFKKAIALDASYARRIPDLTRLEQAKAAFAGDVLRPSDGTIQISYDWDTKDELRDWVGQEASPSIEKGRLYLKPKNSDGLMIGKQEVHFTSDLFVELKLPPSSDGSAGVGVVTRTPKGLVGYEVVYDARRGQAIVIDLANQKTVWGPAKASRGLRELRMELRGGDIVVIVGGATRCRFTCPVGIEALHPVVGTHGGTAGVDSLKIGGRVSRDWLRKVYAGADGLLQELLAEDALGAPKESWDRGQEPLSAEDPDATAGMDERALTLYLEAKEKIEKMETAGLLQALVDLSKIIRKTPNVAAPYYQRARIAFLFRKYGPALHDLNRALERAGAFHEALAERALVLTRLQRLEEAQKDVDKALSWAPGSSRTRFAQGWVQFRRYELEKSQGTMELSFALGPRGSDDTAAVIRRLGHVIQGPAWEKPFQKETPHYLIRTDISQEAVDTYARQLEAIRPIYGQLLDLPVPPDVDARRSRVLVFDSRTGYLAYNVGAEGTALESALGYYSPSHRQLLLYEDIRDKSGEETIDTLFHEGFHQWADGVLVELPTWVNEGLAEYFGTIRVDPSDGSIRNLGAVQKGRLHDLRYYHAEKKKFWAFDDIMNQSHEKFMAEDAAFKYAQTWSMVHFLVEGERGKWRKLLRQYLLHIRAGRLPAVAYNRTFGRVDMDALEKAWLEHVKAMPSVEDE